MKDLQINVFLSPRADKYVFERIVSVPNGMNYKLEISRENYDSLLKIIRYSLNSKFISRNHCESILDDLGIPYLNFLHDTVDVPTAII